MSASIFSIVRSTLNPLCLRISKIDLKQQLIQHQNDWIATLYYPLKYLFVVIHNRPAGTFFRNTCAHHGLIREAARTENKKDAEASFFQVLM